MSRPTDRRRAPRLRAVGRAHLRTVSCRRIAPGVDLPATVQDISEVAVGLELDARLCRGDRLHLKAEFFGVTLDVEVAVASARRPPGARATVVGCRFAATLTGEQRIALERVLLARQAQDDLGLGARFTLGA